MKAERIFSGVEADRLRQAGRLRVETRRDAPHGIEVEFGIWTLPATMGAVRLAAEARFEAAHYDAVERDVRRLGGMQITTADVARVKVEIDSHEAAICGQCGLFHAPPACEVAR